MKWAVVICLATPVAILSSSGLSAAVPQVLSSVQESGAHGFSEMLYAFSSAGGNNGSAFVGFSANTVFLNLVIGILVKNTSRFARNVSADMLLKTLTKNGVYVDFVDTGLSTERAADIMTLQVLQVLDENESRDKKSLL